MKLMQQYARGIRRHNSKTAAAATDEQQNGLEPWPCQRLRDLGTWLAQIPGDAVRDASQFQTIGQWAKLFEGRA
jgi:hypothetical protein